MITLSPDEVALFKSLLVAMRGIKTREIDRALMILSKVSSETQPSQSSRSRGGHSARIQEPGES